MAKDDMDVIIYKILRYLYDCMKAGKTPVLEDMCCKCKLFNIPQSYWNQIIYELIKCGYVRGFMYRYTKDGLVITMTDSVAITIDGVHYLEENKRMKKVQKFLGQSFEIVLETVIAML